MNKRPHFLWNISHRDKDGKLLWEARLVPNLLHDEGERYILQTAFSGEDALPVSFYIGMDARASLAEADTLASLSGEPVGNGYARQAVAPDATANGFAVTQDAGDWQAKTKTVTFTASGGVIGPVDKLFLTDVETGTTGLLISSVAMSAERTLQDGDTINADLAVKLGEAA